MITLQLLLPGKYTYTILPPLIILHILYVFKRDILNYDLNQFKDKKFWLLCYSSFVISILLQSFGTIIVETTIKTNKIQNIESNIMSVIIYTVFIMPVIEEVIFRHLLVKWLGKKSFLLGSILSSILFAVGHFNIQLWFGYFLLGFFWCYLYRKSNIATTITVHIILNFVALIMSSMR